MTASLLGQILVTVILVPVSLGILDYLRGRREKRHRFDERRLTAYSQFTQSVAEVLWSNDVDEAEMRRQRAWTCYESIALISTEDVVKAAVRVRHAVTAWVDRMNEAKADGLDFSLGARFRPEVSAALKAFHSAQNNKVYRELAEFNKVARKNMGLAALDTDDIDAEIRKFYEY